MGWWLTHWLLWHCHLLLGQCSVDGILAIRCIFQEINIVYCKIKRYSLLGEWWWKAKPTCSLCNPIWNPFFNANSICVVDSKQQSRHSVITIFLLLVFLWTVSSKPTDSGVSELFLNYIYIFFEIIDHLLWYIHHFLAIFRAFPFHLAVFRPQN